MENTLFEQMSKTFETIQQKIEEIKVELGRINERLENSDIVAMSQKIRLIEHQIETHLEEDKENKKRFWDAKKAIIIALMSVAYNVYQGQSQSELAESTKADMAKIVKELMDK